MALASLLAQVDWAAVWQAVRDLTPGEVLVLLLVVAVRQSLNAGPLAIFVPALPLRRAVANDLSANVVATVAPPPADIVLRISMLRSWGIGTAEGLGGISLNTLTYYVARFGASVLGLAVAFVAGQVEPSFVWTALTSGLVAGAVVTGLVIASRGARAAAGSAASAVSIVVALLISYPLTALPFAGIGVLDAAALTIIGPDTGPWETPAIAGMVVFRVAWILVALALGAVTVLWRRRTQRGAEPAGSSGGGPPDRDDEDRDEQPQQHHR